MLESLLSLSIAALILSTVYASFSVSVSAPNKAERIYVASEMARSVLDEAAVLYPEYESEGVYAGRWTWSIIEHEGQPLAEGRYNALFSFVQLDATVSETQDNAIDVVLTRTILVHRKDGQR